MPEAVTLPEKPDTQVASPVTSDVSIFPAHGAPPVIFTCPATSSLAPGVLAPIPILPLVPYIQFPILS